MKNISLTNGNHTFTFGEVGTLAGFEYPEAKVAIEDVAGDKSAVWLNSKAGRRRLSFQFLIDYDQRHNLQKVLRLGNTKLLKFKTVDDLELQTYVEVQNLVLPYKVSRQIGLLELVAPDWRFLSQEEHEYDTVETVISGGISIPAVIPFDMSGGEGAQEAGVTNEGNETADVDMIVHGPMTACYLQNVTTGEYMTITESLDNDESITISSKDKTIVKNGVTNIYDSLTSGYFWKLNPGFNYIQFTVEGQDIETLLTIKWRDSYIGV